MASGSPSKRCTISAMARALVSLSAKEGGRAGSLHEKGNRGILRQDWQRQELLRIRHGQWVEWPFPLGTNAQRSARRGQDRQLRRLGQQGGNAASQLWLRANLLQIV